MGTIDDPGDARHHWRSERERVRDMGNSADAEAIDEWADTLSGELSTRTTYLTNVRKFAEHAYVDPGVPLTEITEREFYRLKTGLEDGTHANCADPDTRSPATGYAKNSVRAYMTHARLFLRDYLKREWAEDIDPGPADLGKIKADDVLIPEECDALLQAATETRDKALIAVMLATGQRVGALLSLTVGSVDYRDASRNAGVITLNDTALGRKGANGRRDLLWSTEYVKRWLTDHPRQSDPDAPLFIRLRAGSSINPVTGERTTWDSDAPMSPQAVGRRLKKAATGAGLDPSKVHAHVFRHTFVTQMRREGVDEGSIKRAVGWGEDSSQFKRYSHVLDNQYMNSLREQLGYDPVAEPDVGAVGSTCPTPGCDTDLAPGASFCPGCGTPLRGDAAEKLADAQERAETTRSEAAIESDGEVTIIAEKLAGMIKDNPEMMEKLLEE